VGFPARRLLLIGYSLSLALPMSAGSEERRPIDGDRVEATLEQEETEQEAETPRSHTETVVVTATRGEETIVDSIALVSALDSDELSNSPGTLVDEALSRVPGFGLFRRNTSFISHPTTTGVSLRGIGPSGASRTLVLWDGVPLNDPFGNWVYWNRLPTLFLDRIEVARGAASPLYGSSALGGTVQLFSRRPEAGRLRARAQLGSFGIQDAEVMGSHEADGISVVGAARMLNSDGYHRIRAAERGAVDQLAGVDFRSMVGRAASGPVHFSINYYAEDRANGTPLQVNNSRLVMLEGGVTQDNWDLRVFGQDSRLNSDFSRILPGRNEERRTAQQMFEYSGVGGVFTTQIGEGLQAGGDWMRSSWGDHAQNRFGGFVQKRLELVPSLEVLADGRVDLWQNAGAKASVNPRVGVRYHVLESATLRASAYRGFRAPSLNELYRPFRVGNVRVAANDQLGEETLYGAEGGLDYYPTEKMLVRGNAYWNWLRDTVGNVTLEVNDEGVFRQRQNIGRSRARGFEAEVYVYPDANTEFFAAYLFSVSKVEETGLRLPQVPFHQGVVGAAWHGPVSVRTDLRFMGDQFEDDRNELPMEGFVSVGLRVSYPVNDRFHIFVAGENLLDAEIIAARTPIETLGTPRAVHVGMDIDLGR
jgi:outer membrane receptor protein involved in Fe transport